MATRRAEGTLACMRASCAPSPTRLDASSVLNPLRLAARLRPSAHLPPASHGAFTAPCVRCVFACVPPLPGMRCQARGGGGGRPLALHALAAAPTARPHAGQAQVSPEHSGAGRVVWNRSVPARPAPAPGRHNHPLIELNHPLIELPLEQS